MKNQIKDLTASQKLRHWLDSIPYGEYNKVITELVQKCKVDKFTFNNWRYGRCRIPELAKAAIEEYAGKKIF